MLGGEYLLDWPFRDRYLTPGHPLWNPYPYSRQRAAEMLAEKKVEHVVMPAQLGVVTELEALGYSKSFDRDGWLVLSLPTSLREYARR